MKGPYKFVLVAILATVLVGCTTPQEVVYEDPPGSGNQVTNIVYQPDPRLQEGIDKALAVHDGLSPLNPYATLTQPLIQGVGNVLLLGAALVAAFKNNQKKKALKAVIQGVEASPDAPATKTSIGKMAEIQGTAAVTKAVVNSLKA